jgi:hypothetical protein
VEEAPFLMAVQGDVGGVQVDHNLPRGPLMSLQEQVHHKRIHLADVAVDLVILGPVPLGPVLDPVQRALAGQRLAVLAPHRLQLAGQHRQGRVPAQFVVVVQVFPRVRLRRPEGRLPPCRPPG